MSTVGLRLLRTGVPLKSLIDCVDNYGIFQNSNKIYLILISIYDILKGAINISKFIFQLKAFFLIKLIIIKS